ncbi:MAG: hypothetical protein ACRC56_08410 [Bosea sp. (in: a-proteobacteria)]
MAALAYQLSADPLPLLAALAEPARRKPGLVNERPLHSAAAQTEKRFTAWHGRSGRRYVASVFRASDAWALTFVDAVLIAVSAERRILAVRDSGPFGVEAALGRWRDQCVAAGATEFHVHLLAEDAEARRQALIDLMPEA